MKALTIRMLPVIIGVLAASAAAQTTTDEARALAEQATTTQQRLAWAHAPVAEPVAAGDYRAQAQQQMRVLQWQATQRDLLAYSAGVRMRPLAVNSTDSARAESQRTHAEQALAERAAVLRSALAL